MVIQMVRGDHEDSKGIGKSKARDGYAHVYGQKATRGSVGGQGFHS